MEDVETAKILTPSVEIGRRERKRRDTRSRLVKAAMALFVEQGYDGTSIDQIARRAGVSRRTCFRYFPSKEDLAFPYREGRLRRFDALIQQGAAGESAYERVKRACMIMAGEFMSQRGEVVVVEQLVRQHPALRAREREYDRHWEQVIAAALASDGSTDDALARLLAGAVMGLIRSAFEQWLEADGKQNLIELAQRIYLLLDHGAPALLGPSR